MVFGDGHESLLLDLEPAPFDDKTDAPMLAGTELRAFLANPTAGIMYVEVFASDFDLNRDGLADCVIGVSGAGNACEFLGEYYVLFSDPGGRARATKGFAHCNVFSRFSLLDAGSLQLDLGKTETVIVDPSGRVKSSARSR
jgi:hypothetical protein